jgi:glycosyltransferase 2 family protein
VTKFLMRWALPLAILAALIALTVRKIDFGELGQAFRVADWRLVALASLAAGTVCMSGLIVRFWTLLTALGHDTPVGLWDVASIYYASSAAHNLLPAPAGEVLRSLELKRRHGYGVGVTVAAQLIEKVVECLGLGIGTLVVACIGGLPRALGVSMFAFAALGAGGAALAMIVGWRWKLSTAPYRETHGIGIFSAFWAHVLNFLRRLGEGLHHLRSPWVWLRALLWSMLGDAANALTVGLCLMAVGISLPIAAWFLVMLMARLAGIIPSTPGQFGVQEAGEVVALSLVGVDHNRALAVALLHHAAHFVPVTLIGLFELRRQWTPRGAAT